MIFDDKYIRKILLSIQDNTYIHSHDLSLSPAEFYNYVIYLVDQEFIINVPDPVYKDNDIIYFGIKGTQLTNKGEEYIKNYKGDVEMFNEVFIVHGHDDNLKNEVARVIEKVGLKAIILNEQTNEGMTLMQKFRKYSQNAGYAVILMTPDDKGKGKDDKRYRDRARQNVILEYGYFMGKLGANRVCVIYKDGVELPSDVTGVVYVSYDENGAWKTMMMKELEAAGYSINWSNI